MFIDFPDPVVARYLARVRELPPRARVTIDLSAPRAFVQGIVHFDAALLAAVIITPVIARTHIALSMTDASPEALLAYRTFYESLRAQRWTTMGRMIVARGLLAVRVRDADPVSAQRWYSNSMGGLIPRHTIDWRDGEALSEKAS
ncbi:MAG TPA: hypothetical protein VE967_01190 [Gemmatimonadaceae bacterium]|nr:hypothetical protein [Gemmatimonadaceae bacterium]